MTGAILVGRAGTRRDHAAPWAAGLLDLDLEVEDEADDLLHEGFHHGVEHVAALALVLHQRVALRHRPQPDALAEVVHLVQVLAPLAVQHGQQDPPLQLAHDLRAEGLLAPVVRGLGVGLEVASISSLRSRSSRSS